MSHSNLYVQLRWITLLKWRFFSPFFPSLQLMFSWFSFAFMEWHLNTLGWRWVRHFRHCWIKHSPNTRWSDGFVFVLFFPLSGFSVSTDNRVHVFKPVSVQAMWWGKTIENLCSFFFFLSFTSFHLLDAILIKIVYCHVRIFPPNHFQTLYGRSALQSLHKACEVARCHNYFPGSLFLTWVSYYQSRVSSDQTRINEWNAMQDVQSHRADSPVLFSDM